MTPSDRGPHDTTLDLEAILATLERTPRTFRAMLEGLPEDLLHTTEGGETWSPFDVVGHLVHGERTDWIPRLEIILNEGESRPFDPFDRFAQLEASRGKSIGDLLAELEGLRTSNIERLRARIGAGLDLAAAGTHPDFGRVTAGELLSTWAAHDLGHVAQIARVLAKRFGEDAGPWRAYLPILEDRT